MHAHFLIGSFTRDFALHHALESLLDKQSYQIRIDANVEDFVQWASQNRHRVDGLVLTSSPESSRVLEQLKSQNILLPALLVDITSADTTVSEEVPTGSSQVSSECQTIAASYHEKVICVAKSDLQQLDNYIQQAINQFLALPYTYPPEVAVLPPAPDHEEFTLSLQQQRLADKLRERLGYLGVYYKRDPSNFVRNLSPEQRETFFQQLRKDYRVLLLSYFQTDDSLNDKIDNLVNMAFFADVSVSKIVEIHMEMMETFANQLKLEGRSEEILLDYRLTLIDVMAHLCEMYRRSLPRKQIESAS